MQWSFSNDEEDVQIHPEYKNLAILTMQGYWDQDWDALQPVRSAFCLLFVVYA